MKKSHLSLLILLLVMMPVLFSACSDSAGAASSQDQLDETIVPGEGAHILLGGEELYQITFERMSEPKVRELPDDGTEGGRWHPLGSTAVDLSACGVSLSLSNSILTVWYDPSCDLQSYAINDQS